MNFLSELEKHCSPIQPSGEDDVFILCPQRDHNENTPSCRVSIRTGAWYCFGKCGRGGHWNEIAELIGASGISKEDVERGDTAFQDLARQLEKTLNHDEPAKIPPSTDWEGSWNGMSGSFLREHGARVWYDSRNKDENNELDPCERILFPCYVQGELRGTVARRLDDGTFRKWRNSPGSWAKTSLFPYDSVSPVSGALVLVEGPGDALRFLYHGLPALSILGTGGWGDECLSLILAKWPEKVAICFDGDEAGAKATEVVKTSLRAEFSPESIIVARLPDGKDPGNVAEPWIRKFKAFLNIS